MDFFNKTTSATGSIGSSGTSASVSSSSDMNGSMFGGLNIQRISLILMFVALFLSLISMGYLMWKSTNSNKWPPFYAECPDHWVKDNSNNCVDVHGLTGKTNNIPRSVSFEGDMYKGAQGLCQKQRWAKTLNYVNMPPNSGIAWDGIDVNSNPDLCIG